MMHIICGASLMHLLENHEKTHITTREGMRLACQTCPASRAMPHICKITNHRKLRGFQYGIIVRHNLTMHRSDTPFVIWQPICRPHLLERVYKPIHTLY